MLVTLKRILEYVMLVISIFALAQRILGEVEEFIEKLVNLLGTA